MMTCCIIDDEPHAISILTKFTDKIDRLSLVFSATEPVAALRILSQMKRPPDIVFCDIEMPEMSGMEFGGLIPLESQLVYTTAYEQYAIESFAKNAVDYLLKPIFFENFEQSVLRCRKRRSTKIEVVQPAARWPKSFLIHNYHIHDHNKGNYTQVFCDTLMYIKVDHNILMFFNEGQQEPLLSYMNFKQLDTYLDPLRFIRVHRSYIVNINYIKGIKLGKVQLLHSNITIDLSQSFRKKLMGLLGDKVL